MIPAAEAIGKNPIPPKQRRIQDFEMMGALL